jgi:hypothetical protein
MRWIPGSVSPLRPLCDPSATKFLTALGVRYRLLADPDGGMFATVGDLQRLWHGFLRGEVVSAQLVASFTARSANYRDDIGYGYGLWIRDNGDHLPVYFIEGCDVGVSIRSSLHLPITVVTVVSNSTNGAWPIDKMVNELVRNHMLGR